MSELVTIDYLAISQHIVIAREDYNTEVVTYYHKPELLPSLEVIRLIKQRYPDCKTILVINDLSAITSILRERTVCFLH